MGYYINPKDRSKECWLKENAQRIYPAPTVASAAQLFEFIHQQGELFVCLVDNGPFTAAAIGYSAAEVEDFAQHDGRDKTWFSAPISKLLEVEPSLRHEIRN